MDGGRPSPPPTALSPAVLNICNSMKGMELVEGSLMEPAWETRWPWGSTWGGGGCVGDWFVGFHLVFRVIIDREW